MCEVSSPMGTVRWPFVFLGYELKPFEVILGHFLCNQHSLSVLSYLAGGGSE